MWLTPVILKIGSLELYRGSSQLRHPSESPERPITAQPPGPAPGVSDSAGLDWDLKTFC